jgi:hypothetical protein
VTTLIAAGVILTRLRASDGAAPVLAFDLARRAARSRRGLAPSLRFSRKTGATEPRSGAKPRKPERSRGGSEQAQPSLTNPDASHRPGAPGPTEKATRAPTSMASLDVVSGALTRRGSWEASAATPFAGRLSEGVAGA